MILAASEGNILARAIEAGFNPLPIHGYTQSTNLAELVNANARFDSGPQLVGGMPLLSTFNGDETHGEGPLLSSVNPNSPSQIITQYYNLGTDPAIVNKIVTTANRASDEFAALPLETRVAALHHIAEVATERQVEIDSAIQMEIGKIAQQANAGSVEGIDFANYYAVTAKLLFETGLIKHPGEDAGGFIFRNVGSCLDVDPGNFPYAIGIGQAALTLAGANAVILKPSPKSPYIGRLVYETIVEGLKRAGVEIPGLVNIVYGHINEVNAFLDHPLLRATCYTGGIDGGRAVTSKIGVVDFGERKRIAQETNGVNSSIVLEDALLEKAAVGVVRAKKGFAGQKCSAHSWALVQDSVYDRFKQMMFDNLDQVVVGDVRASLDGSPPDYGALLTADDHNKLVHQMAYLSSKYMGSQNNDKVKLVYGSVPQIVDPNGNYSMKPIVFEVDLEKLSDDEIRELRSMEFFGPVSFIAKVRDLDEGIRVESMSRYGLTGSVWTEDIEKQREYVRKSRVGNKYVNRDCTGAAVGTHSFGGGGVNDSGQGGKAGGPFSVLNAVHLESVAGHRSAANYRT